MSGPCLSPDVPGHALTPGTRRSLGGPLPHQLADRKWADPRPPGLCPPEHEFRRDHQVLPALSQRELPPAAIPESGVRYPFITHPFATNFPSSYPSGSSFDLHALATPPAFVLSQDQTLLFLFVSLRPRTRRRRSDSILGLTLLCAHEKASRSGPQAEPPPQNPTVQDRRDSVAAAAAIAPRSNGLTSSRRQTCSLVKEQRDELLVLHASNVL